MLLPQAPNNSGAFVAEALKGIHNAALNHLGDREYQSYSSWQRACRQAHPTCTFRGDKDIGAAVVDGRDVGEWDGVVGSVYSNRTAQTQGDVEMYQQQNNETAGTVSHSYVPKPNVALDPIKPLTEPTSPPRVSVKITDNTGNSWISTINGTFEDAQKYYLGQQFNFGDSDAHPGDKIVTVTNVDLLDEEV